MNYLSKSQGASVFLLWAVPLGVIAYLVAKSGKASAATTNHYKISLVPVEGAGDVDVSLEEARASLAPYFAGWATNLEFSYGPQANGVPSSIIVDYDAAATAPLPSFPEDFNVRPVPLAVS